MASMSHEIRREIGRSALAAGMDGYVAKPDKIEDLASQLRWIWSQDEV